MGRTDYLADIAAQTFINLNPSPQWASRQLEPYRGLPFGTFLHRPRPRRQRALTGNLANRSEGTLSAFSRKIGLSSSQAQHTDAQVCCSFLHTLPLDVRLMIYEMVLGGMYLHLSAPDTKSPIQYFPCKMPDRYHDHSSWCHCCSDSTLAKPTSEMAQEYSQPRGLLSLLMTCRQIYSEAIHTLYSANSFEFTQTFAAFTFLTQMLPSHRLSSIRHFRLHLRVPRHPAANARATRDWVELWRLFADEMSGLQSLSLELQMLQPVEDAIVATADDHARRWMQPMLITAFQARRERGCDVQLETRRVRHEPARIIMECMDENDYTTPEDAMDQACARLHRSIRLSLLSAENIT